MRRNMLAKIMGIKNIARELLSALEGSHGVVDGEYNLMVILTNGLRVFQTEMALRTQPGNHSMP